MGELTEGTKGADVASEDRFALLWRRVKEHRIAQWTVGYVAVAYGIQHAVTLTSEAFKWPDNVLRVSMLLLALGLPVAMALAWYHGERVSRRITGGEAAIVSALLVLISLVFYVFVRPTTEGVSTTQRAAIAAPMPANGISLAVLPFVNLSSDKEQEFFSDGMTEEVTSALAKIPNLRVVARTSAFAFKGQNRDIGAIAQALHATHLIEGSVRKDGNEVRITAQLIRAGDDTHLWTESYDRELNGVFAIQEEIAQAIAAALQVPLGLKQGQTLVSNRNIDPDDYQQYLLARSLVRARELDRAIAILEPLTARNPNYAPASALLADSKYLLAVYFTPSLRSGSIDEARRDMQSLLDSAATAARRAIESDPKNAFALGALASVQYVRRQWTEADDLFRQALMLDPNDPEILQAYSTFLAIIGRLKDGLSARQQQRLLEPFVPIYALTFAGELAVNGQPVVAIQILEATPGGGPIGFNRDLYLAYAYASAGRFMDAANTLLVSTGSQVSRQSIEDAARLLRRAPMKAAAPEKLPRFDSELNFVYAYVGAPDRMLEFPERIAGIGYVTATAHIELWAPSSAPLRKTERFKAYLRKLGLVDYWRARGWPDLCHPTTGDDFECS